MCFLQHIKLYNHTYILQIFSEEPNKGSNVVFTTIQFNIYRNFSIFVFRVTAQRGEKR